MKLTDNLFQLYLRKIVIPKAEDFSKPGFIFNRLTEDPDRFLRDVFVSEDWVADLERKYIDKYQENGKNQIYSVGKNAGYVYARFNKLTTITDADKKVFEEKLRELILYLTGNYGSDADYEFNTDERTLRLSYSRFVVCEKNGIGLLVITGSAAGIWAYLMRDKSLEGVHPECLGRGYKKCIVYFGPPQKIEKYGTIYPSNDLQELEMTAEYLNFNSSDNTTDELTSLDSLITGDIVEFKDGKLLYHDHIFFNWDIHYLYMLETRLEDQNLLFESAKDSYTKLGEQIGDKLTTDYIRHFLGALGWGDVKIYDGPTIEIKKYPYTTLYNKSTYTIIRGILSGLLKACYKEEINLKEASVNMENTGLSLIIK